MSDLVLTQVEGRVALITINDPDRRNAVTADISAALRAAVDAAEADTDVHAVIVTGAGKAFCAGANLTALGSAAEVGLRVGGKIPVVMLRPHGRLGQVGVGAHSLSPRAVSNQAVKDD